MTRDRIKTISPATDEIVCEINGTTLDEARNAAKRASTAFQAWASVPLMERKSIVAKALTILIRRREELGKELTLQMGRPIRYGPLEIDTMQKRANYLLGIAERALEDLPGENEPGFKRVTRKEPIGPTLLIFAWNVSFIFIPGNYGYGSDMYSFRI